jgi:molecular chaperone GrpE
LITSLQRVRYIFPFAYARNLAFCGDSSRMDEDQKEQQETDTKHEESTQALDEEKRRSEECLTRLKYMQADFENLKKRSDRQLEEVRKYSNERLVIELLGVVDELEMAVKSSRSSKSAEVMIQGVEMTLKKLKKVLENEGVTPINCLGEPFDPSKHNAVEKVEKDGVEDYTVVEEVRKGYALREKVIRPSIVKIVVKPSSKSQEGACSNE